MLNSDAVRRLMDETVKEAAKSVAEDHGVHPKVGAVLADADGTVLHRAHRGERKGCHAEFLCLEKAGADGPAMQDCSLFVSLEPCTARGPGKKSCTTRIIESGIANIYIGMLDPNPAICGRGETRLRYELCVERFPAKLVATIEDLNREFVDLHKSAHLSRESLYVKSQIHQLMRDHLVRSGIPMDEDLPLAVDLTISDIVQVCEATCLHIRTHDLDVCKIVEEARASAYDKKYADRTYDDDGRGLGDYWENAVRSILAELGTTPLTRAKVVVVGIGNGLEGKRLYIECENLTAVDIGARSLARAAKVLPAAALLQSPAEALDPMTSGSQDVYISLRTYQSTYFDRNAAVREAYRVVRRGGIVLISIANGFLEQGSLIPGLLIPGTAVVDRDLGFEVAGQVRSRMSTLGFEELGVRTSLDEIYIYGRRGR